jgi:hypothetical protein
MLSQPVIFSYRPQTPDAHSPDLGEPSQEEGGTEETTTDAEADTGQAPRSSAGTSGEAPDIPAEYVVRFFICHNMY